MELLNRKILELCLVFAAMAVSGADITAIAVNNAVILGSNILSSILHNQRETINWTQTGSAVLTLPPSAPHW